MKCPIIKKLKLFLDIKTFYNLWRLKMNTKDNEAFEKWINLLDWSFYPIIHKPIVIDDMRIAWQAACEYKQKEIDNLKNVTYWTIEQDGRVTRHISIAEIEKLQEELFLAREAASSEAALVKELRLEIMTIKGERNKAQFEIDKLGMELEQIKDTPIYLKNTCLEERVAELIAENAKLKKFISALGYEETVDDVIESLKELEVK